MRNAMEETPAFLLDVFTPKKIDDAQKKNDLSISAFGWNMARGIVTFIFGLLAMGLITPLLFVRVLNRFGFAMLIPAAIMGLVAFILTLTVWFGTPGKNMSGTYFKVAQGVSFGTFIALAGSVLLLTSAAFDGIMNLIGFIRGLKKT